MGVWQEPPHMPVVLPLKSYFRWLVEPVGLYRKVTEPRREGIPQTVPCASKTEVATVASTPLCRKKACYITAICMFQHMLPTS